MQKTLLICRVAEDVFTETRNGKQVKVIKFLASDERHYLFRLEKRTSNSQSVLATQCIEIINKSM